jgi:predicted secreted protein
MAITTAKGTQFKISDLASPPNYVSIGQVRTITGITVKAHTVDVTTHDTPGFFRKFLAVILDPITASFDINFDHLDATHAFATGLYNQMVGLIKSGFEQIFPNAAGTLAGAGYVTSHDFSAPIDNVLVAKIAVQFTDAITAT